MKYDKPRFSGGVSPSGKAPGFDPGMPWFESRYPSHILKNGFVKAVKDGYVAQLVRAQHS